jgi:hypothetical protein
MRPSHVHFFGKFAMNNLSVARVGARAIDVGYFNTKFSLGRSVDAGQTIIGTGLLPSLAPRLSSDVSMQSPGTMAAADSDSVFSNVRGFQVVGEMMLGQRAACHGKTR